MIKIIFILLGFVSYVSVGFGQDTTYNSVIKQLLVIDNLDQKYRNQINETQTKFGGDSKEMKVLFKNMNVADSTNLRQVASIIDRYGWLSYKAIGSQANSTLFMVIQHSNLQTQVRYLPLMREAVKKGDAKANELALLEDRVALRQGKKQIYGSQISWNMKANTSFVAPMEDPDNVDARRAEVGLSTLAVYLAEMDIKWNVEQYKKRITINRKRIF